MVDYRIELIAVPVSDVDRARAFYGDTLGWPVDHDHTVDENIRFVQVTPPGSACSIAIGRGVSQMEPGSLQAIQAVVASADEALADLTARGVEADGVDDQAWGLREVHRPRRQRLDPAGDPRLRPGERVGASPSGRGRERTCHISGGVPPPRRHPTGSWWSIALAT